MVRPKKIPRNFVPQPWISEPDSEDDQLCYNELRKTKVPAARKRHYSPEGSSQLASTNSVPERDPQYADSDLEPDLEPPDPDFDSDSDQYSNHSNESSNYHDLLDEISKKWLIVELDHCVSKAASDAYWKLALKHFHGLLEAKKEEKITRKTPQFTHVRRTLRKKFVPPITMELGYRNTNTNEESHIVSTNIPRNQFPKPDYTQLYEIASVKVRN